MRIALPMLLLVAMLVVGSSAPGQIATNAAAETSTDPGEVIAEQPGWEFSITTFGYLVPDSRDFVQPTVTADRGWLHLEARYNYEDLETGSAWLGYNLGGGGRWEWEFTPMFGGVFGCTQGIAPGYRGSLSWWKFKLYSEGEYVIDTKDSSSSFLYNWSELTISPLEWLRVGMVTQRTRVYDTDREIERGILAGFSFGRSDLTFCIFDPDESKPTLVLGISLTI